MSNEVLDEMIGQLTGELQPVNRLAHPLRRAVFFGALAVLYVASVVLFVGVRADIADKLHDLPFLFELSIAGLVALSSGLASAWLAVPDYREQRWLLFAPLAGLFVFVLWSVLRGYVEGAYFQGVHWDHCFEDGALMGILPAALIMFMARGGATTHPLLMAGMNVLSFGALAYIGLRFTCAMDTIGHGCITHLLPFILIGVLMGAAARRLYRW
ncbi:MAG: DUF1109 domain-containing protein [Alphaproteobacteria bacterium]|nr:DUF1109 domain-containing protein [Alphaproteobacteria bacterium]